MLLGPLGLAGSEEQISLYKKVDAAMCDSEGIKVIVGNHFYHFASPKVFIAGRSLPEQQKVSLQLFGCDH